MSKRTTIGFAGVTFDGDLRRGNFVNVAGIGGFAVAVSFCGKDEHCRAAAGQLTGIGPEDAPVRSAVLTQSDRDHIKVQEAHWGWGGYRAYYGPQYYAGYGPRYYAGYAPYYSYYPAPYYNSYYPTPYVAAYPSYSYSYFPAPYYSYPPIYTAVPRRAFYAPRGYYYW